MSQYQSLALHIDTFQQQHSYYPYLLLCHTDIARLHHTAQWVKETYRYPLVSIGELLSEALLAETPAKQPMKADAHLQQILGSASISPLLCVDVDILFMPGLQLNPLYLLQNASRITPLIILWPGSLSEASLSYATPQHQHYRTWPRRELCPHCAVAL